MGKWEVEGVPVLASDVFGRYHLTVEAVHVLRNIIKVVLDGEVAGIQPVQLRLG